MVAPLWDSMSRVIGHLIPKHGDAYDLGSPQLPFRNLYLTGDIVENDISLSGTLTFTAAAGQIIPGATSIAFRNNANNANNLLITDAGIVTIRAGLILTAGTFTMGATNSQIIPGATSFAIRNNANNANNLRIFDNGTVEFRNNVTFTSGSLIGTADLGMFVNTTDGADTGFFRAAGGGSFTASRGGFIVVYGNENVAETGDAILSSGNASGANLELISASANGSILLKGAGNLQWTIDNATGTITQDGTNGGNIVFVKNNTGVRNSVSNTLTATGTIITDALQLSSIVNNLTTVAAGTGAKLSDTVGIGTEVAVRNGGANALLLYPPDGSGTINGGGAGASVSIATGATGRFTKVAANTWIGSEAPAA